jgi:hypothetical protein
MTAGITLYELLSVIMDDVPSITSTVEGIKDEEKSSFPDAESFWQWLDTMSPSLVLLTFIPWH